MSTPDCVLLGHLLCDADPECVACGAIVVTGDKVRAYFQRPAPETLDPLDTAQIDGPDSWGHADTGQAA